MKTIVIQSSLNAGELSPLLRGRTELPRYQHGLERLYNFIPLLTGGATRRPGSRYVATAKDNTVRLIGFRDPSASPVGYVLEIGNLYIRFYHAGSQVMAGDVPLEIVTPWQTADLPRLRYVTSDRTIYFTHPSYRPYRLIHRGDDTWIFEPILFSSMPFFRPDSTADIYLRASARTGSVTVYSSGPYFSTAMVGSVVKINSELVLITNYIDSQTVTGYVKTEATPGGNVEDIVPEFTVTDAVSGTVYTLTVTATKAAANTQLIDLFLVPDMTGMTPGVLPPGTADFDITVRKESFYVSGLQTVALTVEARAKRAISGATTLNYRMFAIPVDRTESPGINVTYTTSGAGVSVVFNHHQNSMTLTEPDPGWQMQATFDIAYGYPTACAVFEQRLWLAGSAAAPTTIWGSAIGSYDNFGTGSLDDSAVAFIAAEATMGIRNLFTGGQIFQLCGDREITLTGGNGAITVSNVQMKTRTTHGSAEYPPPIDAVGQTLFFSPSRKKLRALSYRFELDAYVAPDLTVMAEHILGDHGGAVAAAFAREPHSTHWIATQDGTLATLTYDRDQDVLAWARHGTDSGDTVLDMASIPDADGNDQVWLAWQRTLNGQAVTTVEYLDPALCMDAAGAGTSEGGQSTWSAVWLKNEVVDVVADGSDLILTVDNSGVLTLPAPATAVSFGKRFTPELTDLPLDLGMQRQTTQGNNVAVSRVRIRFHHTTGGTINGMIQTDPNLTGDYRVQVMGRGTEQEAAQVTITQPRPFPMTVLSIIKELAVNG